MNFVYALRVLNSLIAAAVVGLCFVKADWRHLNGARNARVAGLGVIAFALIWGSLNRQHEPYKPWVPIFTWGLVLCVYGMSRTAPGETSKLKE